MNGIIVFSQLQNYQQPMNKILLITFISLIFSACHSNQKDSKNDFQSFVNRFEPVELPLDTALLYRVHNSPIVTTRIDTIAIQKFINKNYELKATQPVYDGYAYGVRLPKEENSLYETLIYYQSKGRQQFFILNTYTLDGDFVDSIPFSGDSSSYKRVTGNIATNGIIAIREFLLHQPQEGYTEYIYEIGEEGKISKEATFIQK
jgi:hypothetical protein